jgi:PhnB protein
MITTNTYLSFPGTCEEAFQFYATTLGGKILMSMKGEDMPGADCPADFKGKIMHIRMAVGDAVIMGSDCPPEHYFAPQGFHANIGVDDPKEADRIYAALAKDGKQTMPIAETFWAKRFGMCVDKFGTPWMVNCEKQM